MTTGIGSHTSPNRGASDDWITPPEIVRALGSFDLDPCASLTQPWPCAATSYTVEDNGLTLPWSGRVWCNPPYGGATEAWLHRMAEHGQGTALVFARTETEMFARSVWRRATALLFIEKRLYFYKPNGLQAKGNSGGPSVLIAYGQEDSKILKASGLRGAFCTGWSMADSSQED